MKVADLINKKDYDYISWRISLPGKFDKEGVFVGSCESAGGELIPHDQDFYDKEDEVLSYSEWSKEDMKNGLTVVVGGYCRM